MSLESFNNKWKYYSYFGPRIESKFRKRYPMDKIHYVCFGELVHTSDVQFKRFGKDYFFNKKQGIFIISDKRTYFHSSYANIIGILVLIMIGLIPGFVICFPIGIIACLTMAVLLKANFPKTKMYMNVPRKILGVQEYPGRSRSPMIHINEKSGYSYAILLMEKPDDLEILLGLV